MSTYWTFKCNTCNDKCEDSGNHIDKVLLAVLKVSDCYKKIRESDVPGRYLEFGIMCHSSELIEFVIEHCGHDVIVLSEYGDYYTKDGVFFKRLEHI